jgi:indolepyruvate ferredoxin oxidoreductase alpha subunit
MLAEALALSERFDTPVMVRPTTRISHSHSAVELGAERPAGDGQRPDYHIDTAKYVMVPGNARRRRPIMEERTEQVAEFANEFRYNRVEWGDRRLGIVTCGVAYQYAKEVFPQASFLRLGMTWPLPKRLVADFAGRVERLIVIEELDPVLEEEIKLMGIACEGKSIFPAIGELDPAVVRQASIAAGLLPASEARAPLALIKPDLPPRPPLLCPGCPHRGVFAVTRKLKLVVSGDIGCYTLGYLPPLGALHTCGCMGASIGQAHGVAKAHVNQKHVAVIGDSTFLHTGMPALLNVAYNRSNTVTIILDNRTTAMTGHQDHPATGRTLQMVPTSAVDLVALVRAMGISDVRVVDPYNLQEVEDTLRACTEQDGPSVVIARRECVLLPEARRRYLPLRVYTDKCVGCGLCLRLGCPALSRSDTPVAGGKRYAAQIDPLLCTGCELCTQTCPNGAIASRAAMSAEPSQA